MLWVFENPALRVVAIVVSPPTPTQPLAPFFSTLLTWQTHKTKPKGSRNNSKNNNGSVQNKGKLVKAN